MSSMPDDLLPLLRCPITKRRLVNANPELLDQLNGLILGGTLTSRVGESVEDVLDDGLIDETAEWLYPIRDGIVCLLADDAISLDRLSIKEREAKA